MDIRYQPEQPIRLNVLGSSPRPVAAKVVQMSGKRIEVSTGEAIPCGTAIKIEMEDSLLLGEITACAPGQGEFRALVVVREAIPSMSNLARLVSAVMNEGRTAVRDRTEHAAAAR
jgi:hypothetical protein